MEVIIKGNQNELLSILNKYKKIDISGKEFKQDFKDIHEFIKYDLFLDDIKFLVYQIETHITYHEGFGLTVTLKSQ